MFFGFGKKKEEKTTGTSLTINESLLQMKDLEVIRCINVQAHFNTKDEEQAKLATHDMIRQCLIKIGHTVNSENAINQKEKFEEAVNVEVNRVIANQPFLCDKLSIDTISLVERRR